MNITNYLYHKGTVAFVMQKEEYVSIVVFLDQIDEFAEKVLPVRREGDKKILIKTYRLILFPARKKHKAFN